MDNSRILAIGMVYVFNNYLKHNRINFNTKINTLKISNFYVPSLKLYQKNISNLYK